MEKQHLHILYNCVWMCSNVFILSNTDHLSRQLLFYTFICSPILSVVLFAIVRYEIDIRKLNCKYPKCIELMTGMLCVAGFHQNSEFIYQLNVFEEGVLQK
jgi:hypothetical protein